MIDVLAQFRRAGIGAAPVIISAELRRVKRELGHRHPVFRRLLREAASGLQLDVDEVLRYYPEQQRLAQEDPVMRRSALGVIRAFGNARRDYNPEEFVFEHSLDVAEIIARWRGDSHKSEIKTAQHHDRIEDTGIPVSQLEKELDDAEAAQGVLRLSLSDSGPRLQSWQERAKRKRAEKFIQASRLKPGELLTKSVDNILNMQSDRKDLAAGRLRIRNGKVIAVLTTLEPRSLAEHRTKFLHRLEHHADYSERLQRVPEFAIYVKLLDELLAPIETDLRRYWKVGTQTAVPDSRNAALLDVPDTNPTRRDVLGAQTTVAALVAFLANNAPRR